MEIFPRDQRTTFHRVLDYVVQSCAVNSTLILPFKRQDNVVTSYVKTRSKKNNYAQSLPCDSHLMPPVYDSRRLFDYIRRRLIRPNKIVRISWLKLTYLWLIALIALSLTSSVYSCEMDESRDNVTIAEEIHKRLNTTPKWVEPCGPSYVFPTDINLDSQIVEVPNDKQIIENIIITTETALNQANMFRERYLKEVFKTNGTNMELFKDNHYCWLPGRNEIPKKLGELLTKEYLDTLDFNMTLVNIYKYMQIYEMGLEQIVWDQSDLKLDFYEEFKESEYKCLSLLCEIYGAIIERGLTPQPDVNRTVMPIEYRSEELRCNHTFRDVRDWILYRDYMNGLEYVYQVFNYFRSMLNNITKTK